MKNLLLLAPVVLALSLVSHDGAHAQQTQATPDQIALPVNFANATAVWMLVCPPKPAVCNWGILDSTQYSVSGSPPTIHLTAAGPQGPQGPAGPAGPQGPPGTSGTGGLAHQNECYVSTGSAIFTLAAPPSGFVQAHRSGFYLYRPVDYNWTGQTVTFVAAQTPRQGENVCFDY